MRLQGLLSDEKSAENTDDIGKFVEIEGILEIDCRL
jgi:hypothetical protein